MRPIISRLPLILLLLPLLLVVSIPNSQAAQVIYVDVNSIANGTLNDGSSWANAFNDLQDALDNAKPGATIRVADGTYRPDRGTNSPSYAFHLKDGVSLLGGYAGYGSPDPDQRDVAMFETTLTGLLSGTNSYHVVRSDSNSQTAVIDGFTITHGRSNLHDSPNYNGGGILILGGQPLLRNLTLCENYAEYGGGIFCSDATPTITDCLFSNNEATASGGALYSLGNVGEPGAQVTDCKFTENIARFRGGAIRNWSSSPALAGCSFSYNSASDRGGAIANGGASCPTIGHCVFSENRVISMQNKTYGGAISNFDASGPIITSCAFNSNVAHGMQGSGGAIHNDASSPTLEDCLFRENVSLAGGAIYNDINSNPLLSRCIFFANRADNWGGAISNYSVGNLSSPMRVSNTLFAANQAESDGGAIFSDLTGLTLVNCSFSNNVSRSRGAGIYNYVGCEVSVLNCVFWGNVDITGRTESGQIHNNPSNMISVNHSCIEGWTGTAGGTGNISDDPLFVDTNGSELDEVNFRLTSHSACIDSGDVPYGLVPLFPMMQKDLDGHGRILCKNVDMGAYEFGIADYNCDRQVDAADFESWPLCETGPLDNVYPPGCQAFDFEFNSRVDLIDFAALQELLAD